MRSDARPMQRANGNLDAEKSALADLWRYRSLRFKMFSPA